MALIDKGTHMHDPETGQNFAKASSSMPKKLRKRKNLIRPADSDILFGLWIEYKRGNLTVAQISDATGWHSATLCNHAKKKGFDEKIAKIIKATDKTPTITSATVATNLAASLADGAEAHQMSVNELLAKLRPHFRKMKPGTILKQAKEIKTIDDVGRRLYKLDTPEAVQSGAGPVLNVAFLLNAGTATPVAAPIQEPPSES